MFTHVTVFLTVLAHSTPSLSMSSSKLEAVESERKAETSWGILPSVSKFTNTDLCLLSSAFHFTSFSVTSDKTKLNTNLQEPFNIRVEITQNI